MSNKLMRQKHVPKYLRNNKAKHAIFALCSQKREILNHFVFDDFQSNRIKAKRDNLLNNRFCNSLKSKSCFLLPKGVCFSILRCFALKLIPPISRCSLFQNHNMIRNTSSDVAIVSMDCAFRIRKSKQTFVHMFFRLTRVMGKKGSLHFESKYSIGFCMIDELYLY